MNAQSTHLRYLLPVFLGLLNACSGGNVNVGVWDPEFPPWPPTQSSEAIAAHGMITGLGGVTVNDVRYTVNGAPISINGQPGTLSDLRHGQIVTLRGRINADGRTGSANDIRFDANVIGPIESLDASSDWMMVMGQHVTTGPDTMFGAGIDPATFSGLSVGNIVQVSGNADAAGAIRATRIDVVNMSTELQLIGKVAGLDPANLIFTINGLTVEYSSAIVIDLPGGAPTNGMLVKIIGTKSNGLFIVERLATTPRLVGNTGQRVQTAGVITRFNSSTDFDVDSAAASANASTAFLNGVSGELALNAELVIDGEFTSSGRIMANRIKFGRLGSQTVTVEFDLADFDEVYVSSVFNVTITQGTDFLVEVTVDEDVAHRVDITKTDSRLNIALQQGDGNIGTLHAFVTMPVLNRINLTGVVNAGLSDFNQAQLTVNVDGVSTLQGNALTISNLTASVSGVSQLALGDIRPIGNADINISGVSQATLNMDVGSTLAGSVATSQSTLFYYGTNVAMDVAAGSGSSVVKLGETRP